MPAQNSGTKKTPFRSRSDHQGGLIGDGNEKSNLLGFATKNNLDNVYFFDSMNECEEACNSVFPVCEEIFEEYENLHY